MGIRNVIGQIITEKDQIDYAALSTTLATNALVEDRGCRVGALILGYRLEESLPQCECVFLPGCMDIMGRETEALDIEMTREAIENLRGKVDAVAVSGFFSVRNPDHEEEVKSLVREILGLPTVAAHELTTALGLKERTVTAILNARLLSVIDQLMNAAKAALKEKGFDVPIMIVKGDGSLMNESVARERPIETILSGPAASIIGATYLHGSEQGLVLDMGGTTTDIAVLKDGRPRLDSEGAKVGGWRTRVAATDANTFGLGGDSRIFYDQIKNELLLGPRRVLPIYSIAEKYPQYIEELKHLRFRKSAVITHETVEGYQILEAPDTVEGLSEVHQQILEILADGPHTVITIGEKIGKDPNLLTFEPLVKHGVIGLIGYTPTDLLHVTGDYTAGDPKGPQLAAELMARRWGLPLDAFLRKTRMAIIEKLCRVILDSVLDYEKAPKKENSPMVEYFIENALWGKKDSLMAHGFSLKIPIIGIGAPVKAWLPQVAEKFHTDLLLPNHYEVANAVGAAVGKVVTIYRILVQNHESEGISIYAPWGKKSYGLETFANDDDQTQKARMNKVVAVAIAAGRKRMVEEMAKQGLADYDVLVEREDSTVSDGYSDNLKIYIETKLEIIAVGRPQWH